MKMTATDDCAIMARAGNGESKMERSWAYFRSSISSITYTPGWFRPLLSRQTNSELSVNQVRGCIRPLPIERLRICLRHGPQHLSAIRRNISRFELAAFGMIESVAFKGASVPFSAS